MYYFFFGIPLMLSSVCNFNLTTIIRYRLQMNRLEICIKCSTKIVICNFIIVLYFFQNHHLKKYNTIIKLYILFRRVFIFINLFE